MNWTDLTVLVTGGTGSFGKKFTDLMLQRYRPRKIIIFSRDELKQHEMSQELQDHAASLRFFIGDVRDAERLSRAFQGVDVVVHAAAMKQIPACEYNPFEAVQTNVIGARNVINAAIDCGVQRAVLVSTDKAVNPINLYGATKLCAEKLFVHGNAYAGARGTRFAVVRYGNVIGSRGSVIPLFFAQRANGYITITDDRMTRFWITLEKGVEFSIRAIEDMEGGELFIPKIPSMKLADLARLMAKGAEIRVVGIRPGEKLHELLISEDDSREVMEFPDRYILFSKDAVAAREKWSQGQKVPAGFRYSSDQNQQWLEGAELEALLREQPAGEGRKNPPALASAVPGAAPRHP